MDSIIIKRLSDKSLLDNFNCGIPDIDKIIHDLNIKEEKGTDFYVAYISDEILAVFALSHGTIKLDTIDIKELDNDYSETDESDIKYESYPALEIELLTVREDMRDHHIGSNIIDIIHYNTQKFGFGDSVFLMVDAYFSNGYTAVPFYESCGFRMTGQKPTLDTLRMFRPIR